MCVRECVCVGVCVCVFVCACACVCTRVCAYTCMYASACVHAHTCYPYHCHVWRRGEIQDGRLGSRSIGIGVPHHFARSVTVILVDVHVIQEGVLHQVEIG